MYMQPAHCHATPHTIAAYLLRNAVSTPPCHATLPCHATYTNWIVTKKCSCYCTCCSCCWGQCGGRMNANCWTVQIGKLQLFLNYQNASYSVVSDCGRGYYLHLPCLSELKGHVWHAHLNGMSGALHCGHPEIRTLLYTSTLRFTFHLWIRTPLNIQDSLWRGSHCSTTFPVWMVKPV